MAVREEQLEKHLNPEDITVLHHRLVLLNKQWLEISNQVDQRKQLISDRLNMWTDFNSKYKEFLDWINKMDARIMSNQEYNIEDLLSNLQNVSFSKFLSFFFVL